MRHPASGPSRISRRTFLTLAAASGTLLPRASRASSGFLANHRPISIFSKHLEWLDYDALAETAAETGVDGVDLTVRPGGHVRPERVAEDLPRAVDAIRKVGLEVYQMTTAITEADHPHTEPILRTAAALGIRVYRMGYLSYAEATDLPGRLRELRDRLAPLAELNARYGLHGAYQNHAGTRVGGPVWDLYLLLDGLDARYIGCQYDVRHAVVEGGQSWPLGLRLLAPYIRTTAIKDFRWTRTDDRWQIQDVPVGEGMVDFRKYFALTRALDIAGPISLHLEYDLLDAADEGRSLTEKRRKAASVIRREVHTLRGLMTEAGI